MRLYRYDSGAVSFSFGLGGKHTYRFGFMLYVSYRVRRFATGSFTVTRDIDRDILSFVVTRETGLQWVKRTEALPA